MSDKETPRVCTSCGAPEGEEGHEASDCLWHLKERVKTLEGENERLCEEHGKEIARLRKGLLDIVAVDLVGQAGAEAAKIARKALGEKPFTLPSEVIAQAQKIQNEDFEEWHKERMEPIRERLLEFAKIWNLYEVEAPRNMRELVTWIEETFKETE